MAEHTNPDQKLIDLGPGSAPRKVSAMICLTFCGLAIPIVLFRMFMGATGTASGTAMVIVLGLLCAAMIAVLRPKEPVDEP